MLGDFMNKNDLRYIKTEKIIKESFIKLVNNKGFEKTSVSDICKEGIISRNAFYLHFADKYDLLERMFDEFGAMLIKSFGSKFDEKLFSKDILNLTQIYTDAMSENREAFLFLVNCSSLRMEQLISKIVIEDPVCRLSLDYKKAAQNIKVRLNRCYIFSAMVAYTKLWIENYDKISKEDATYELYKLCEYPTLMYIENFKII